MDTAPERIDVAPGLSLERVGLRFSDQLFQLVQEQRNYLSEFLWWPHKMTTSDDARRHLGLVDEENRKETALSYFIVKDSRLVGGCGFNLQMKYTRAELGFWIEKGSQGKGITSLCLKTLIRFGFEELGLHRLELRIAPENRRSLSLARKLNFKVEGRIRDALLIGNSYQDMVIHGLLKRDWLTLGEQTGEHNTFTCVIRYAVDPKKLDEFEEYARAWIPLIEKYGGTHHGYFIPGRASDRFPDATFSFPGIGKNGPENIGLALFSFPDVETYNAYRKAVAGDPACKAATERFNETKCFSSYERNFLKPIFRNDT